MSIISRRVAISRPGLPVAVMSIITEAPINSFSIEAAMSLGLTVAIGGRAAKVDLAALFIPAGKKSKRQQTEAAIMASPDARWVRKLTDTVIEAEITKAGLVPNDGWRLVGDGEIDWTDRTFRNAWIDNGKRISIDMDKARGVHRDHLRQLRAPKMTALDVAQLRAQGDDERMAEVLDAKQALRDVTDDPAIDAAMTPAELAAVIPAALAK